VCSSDLAIANGFSYDRNENRQSTSKYTDMSCYATLTLASFVDAAGLPAAESKGGWAFINQSDLDSDSPADNIQLDEDVGILVYKTEAAGSTAATTPANEVDY
jgi:hypothetical protein